MTGQPPSQTWTMTLDGETVSFAPGMTILQVAGAYGIDIPNLCAYPTLKPFGRCRLCLVEIEGVRGYPSACTTPAADGMVAVTWSEVLHALRRDALELVLTEHPTGCLLCGHQDECLEHHGCHARRSGVVTGCRFCPKDQQCELQAMVERLEVHDISFPVKYRGLKVDRRDPFFDRDYNLCILCARCVRICDEVRGAGTVALTFRGASALVGTAYNRTLYNSDCQFCGACVDVCPTAALAERVNKWVGVPDAAVETTCPFCSLGCRLELRTLDGQVVGARPVEHGDLCSKGRFAPVEAALADGRLLEPMVRKHGRLVEVGWAAALAEAAEGLAAAAGVGVFASRNLLNEELAAVAELAARTLATAWVSTDAGLLDGDVPAATASLDGLSAAAVILSVRTDLRYSHTPVQLAIQRAVANGAKLIAVEPFDNDLRRRAALWLQPAPGGEGELARRLLAGVGGQPIESAETDPLLRMKPSENGDRDPLGTAAQWLLAADRVVVVYGGALLQMSGGAKVAADLAALAEAAGAGLLPLLDGSNSRGAAERLPAGAWSVGEPGPEALLSFGRPPFATRPEVGFWVAHTDVLDEVTGTADVVLPATIFSERSGTITDLFSRRREVNQAVPPAGESRDTEWLCRELARRLPAGTAAPSLDGRQARAAALAEPLADGLLLVREYSRFTYRGSALSARVPGLAPLAREAVVQLHPDDALALELSDGDTVEVEGPGGAIEAGLHLTTAVPAGTARLVVPQADEKRPTGVPLEAVLGSNPGRVRVSRAVPEEALWEGERVHV